MKLLLSGGTGKVGRYIKHYAIIKGWHVDTIGRNDSTYIVDFQDLKSVRKITTTIDDYDYVLHTAAMTNVDQCEDNKIAAYNINALSTLLLATAANRMNAHFIYLSTDYIFSGEQGPYLEDAIPNPINSYGSSKLTGERFARSALDPKLLTILRTCVLYDKPGVSNNFIQWLYDKGSKGEPVKVIDDQYVTPTYVPDLARWIIDSIDRQSYTDGIYHLAGPEFISRYDIAYMCYKLWGFESSLERCDSSSLSWKAIRPPKGGLITQHSPIRASFSSLQGALN